MFDALPVPERARLFGSIRFVPDQGTVLWCDMRDFPIEEMGGKIRPIVVVSPRHLNTLAVNVAPLTRTAQYALPHDVCIPADRYPFFGSRCDSWVVVRQIRPVARTRLDRWRVDGRWCAPHISVDDLQRVLAAVAGIFSPSRPLAA